MIATRPALKNKSKNKKKMSQQNHQQQAATL